MSKAYDKFKHDTIHAADIISNAKNMRAVSDEFADGFQKAMWEAREIFMRLEREFTIEPIGTASSEDGVKADE